MALADSADPGATGRGASSCSTCSAPPPPPTGCGVALRREGVDQVPQRPRVSTRANPAGLTNRQLDVAKLVARGFTNAEIAARLYISPKTADHHVSAVLTKLGVDQPTRGHDAGRRVRPGLTT